MKKLLALCIALASTAAFAAPAMATVVNVDGMANASLDGSNGVNTVLGAGTYNLTFTNAPNLAFSRFSSSGGCDGSGANCTFGFENSVRYIIGGTTYLFGDGNASGGYGPVSGGGYYDTAANSFAHSGKYINTFTLTGPTNVDFFLYDDYLGDNRGGVSLNVAPVPEPATWAMLLFGFSMIGFGMRKRPTVRRTVTYA